MTRGILYGLFGTLLSARAIAEPQPEVSPQQKLYQQALIESDRASKLERRGKKVEAIDGYELAARLAEATITEAERSGQAPENRAPEIYFRCATSYLHAGRLLNYTKRDDTRKDEDLGQAVHYLDLVEKIERERAQRLNVPINPELWRVRNAQGYASFLRGELAQARLYYGTVLEMNPAIVPLNRPSTKSTNSSSDKTSCSPRRERLCKRKRTARCCAASLTPCGWSGISSRSGDS